MKHVLPLRARGGRGDTGRVASMQSATSAAALPRSPQAARRPSALAPAGRAKASAAVASASAAASRAGGRARRAAEGAARERSGVQPRVECDARAERRTARPEPPSARPATSAASAGQGARCEAAKSALVTPIAGASPKRVRSAACSRSR